LPILEAMKCGTPVHRRQSHQHSRSCGRSSSFIRSVRRAFFGRSAQTSLG
jgi:hypothetical protein